MARMMWQRAKRSWVGIALALLCAAAVLGGCGRAARTPLLAPDAANTELPPDLTEALVLDVVDGDTLVVRLGGREERLRMLGIDTPETVHPVRPVECFGREASAYTHELLEGQTVLLEDDPTQGNEDRFGRLLRYVWLPDGRMVNRELIGQGYAFEYTYNVPYRYQESFRQAERAARQQQRGLWAPAACAGERIPASDGQENLPTVPSTTSADECDPAYPDVCLPSPPPDLDCRDIDARRFTVLPPDPHNFDGDGNGIACEAGG